MKNLYVVSIVLLCWIIQVLSPAQAQDKSVSNTLLFDGIDDYVSIPNGTANFAGLNAFSMCGWVYPSNTNAVWPDFDGYFGIKNEGICDFYIVQINGTSLEVRLTTDQGQFTIPPEQLTQIVPNQWQHFAIVYTGTELQFFYNGLWNASVPASGTILASNLELTIGKLEYFENDFFLNGKADEITLWSKALDENDLLIYQCITGDPSVIPDLLAYYDFDEEEGLILPDYFGTYNGYLTNMNGTEWIESEVCQSGFDILFVVTDELTLLPVQDAVINLNGVIKNTDQNGEATFNNYENGDYPYGITKSGYYETFGEVIVNNSDTTLNISLAPVVYYAITFIVTEVSGGAPVEDAIVNLDGIIQLTDTSGQTTFTGYLPGSYPWVVLKEGYTLLMNTVEVVDEDVTVNVELVIVGLDNPHEIRSRAFPNPASDKIRIDLRDGADETIISIVNRMGVRIYRQFFSGSERPEIDVAGFPEGIYYLILESEGIKDTFKLVVIPVK